MWYAAECFSLAPTVAGKGLARGISIFLSQVTLFSTPLDSASPSSRCASCSVLQSSRMSPLDRHRSVPRRRDWLGRAGHRTTARLRLGQSQSRSQPSTALLSLSAQLPSHQRPGDGKEAVQSVHLNGLMDQMGGSAAPPFSHRSQCCSGRRANQTRTI